jgi:type I restriction enzyme S subunit
MSEWEQTKLINLCHFQRGHDLSKTEMSGGVYPVAGSNSIIGYHDKYTTKGPSLTIGRSGNIGTPYFYKSDFWAHNTVLYVKNFYGNDPKFAYYFLKNIDFTQYNVGSAVPTLNRNHIHEYEIMLPSLPEQESIAEVLSSLDDKINLLQEQNKTLEDLAQTLFRQCFVEEVDEKGSHKLKDYVLSAKTGLDAIRRAPIVDYETGIKCLRIQDVSQRKPFLKWGNSLVEENNFQRFQLKRDDIIMARTCSPGINYFVREDINAVFNNGLVRIRANSNVHPIFLYQLFKTRDFIGHVDGVSGGTSVQLNMQIGDLLDYDFTFLSKEKQNDYIEQFLAFDKKIYQNSNQINQLESIRDTLLPKLISGAVKVMHEEK